MDENKMGWREYAHYAEMSVEELARDCEVQVFRATGPGGQGGHDHHRRLAAGGHGRAPARPRR